MSASQATTKWSFEGPNLPIDTVTIYRPSEAQVIRKLDLDLEVCRDLLRHPPVDLVWLGRVQRDRD